MTLKCKSGLYEARNDFKMQIRTFMRLGMPLKGSLVLL